MRRKEELTSVCDNQKWYNKLLNKSLKIVQETEEKQKYHTLVQTKSEICGRGKKTAQSSGKRESGSSFGEYSLSNTMKNTERSVKSWTLPSGGVSKMTDGTQQSAVTKSTGVHRTPEP